MNFRAQPFGGTTLRKQTIYLCLRVPAQAVIPVTDRLSGLIDARPGVPVKVVALEAQGDRAVLYLEIDVTVSNSDPSSVAALELMHEVNLSMFDYSPFYNHAPSESDRAAFASIAQTVETERGRDRSAVVNRKERAYA